MTQIKIDKQKYSIYGSICLNLSNNRKLIFNCLLVTVNFGIHLLLVQLLSLLINYIHGYSIYVPFPEHAQYFVTIYCMA